MHFVFMYKNRTVKPVKIVLRSLGEMMKKNDGGGEFIQGKLQTHM